MDRLPDGFFTENELLRLNTEQITPSKPHWDSVPEQRMMSTYNLYKDGKFTNKVLILPTDDQVDTMQALQTQWADTGLSIQLGEAGGMSYGWYDKWASMQIVLKRYNYTPKFKNVGCEHVYNYRQFMEELL